MSIRTNLALILWVAGIAGILSFLFVDLSALLESFPATGGMKSQFPPLAMKLLSVIQPTIILSLAVCLGVYLAPKVCLSAPVAEAASRGENLRTALQPQILPGVAGGFVGGTAIVVSWVLARPSLPPEFVMRAEKLNKLMPIPTRLLYGGITEELLLRWGLMTLLVWAMWRTLQKGQGKPLAGCFIGAIIVSSLVFGLGHLPLAFALAGRITAPVIVYVVGVNSMFGMIAGYLYWQKGLEAAIFAHMLAHVVISTALYLGR